MARSLADLIPTAGIGDHIATLVARQVLTADQGRALRDLGSLDLDDLVTARMAITERGRQLAASADTDPGWDAIEVLSAAKAVMDAVKEETKRRVATIDNRRVAADRLAALIAAAGDETVAAAGRLQSGPSVRLPSLAQLARRAPARTRPNQPSATGPAARVEVLTAAGLPVDDRAGAAAEAARMVDAQVRGRRSWGAREKVPLLTVRADYPADRQLGSDEWANQRAIDAVTGPDALVASGGVCGPVAADYTIASIASPGRPVRSALAQFQATRGGVRYILPHTLAAVTIDAPAAVWTETTDANPGGSTKPHATFACQNVQEAYVDAVTSIVQFGNFQARYFPEQITQYMETVEAVHSRLAEATLLAAIATGSTATVEDHYVLGAARDIFATLDRAVAAYRYRNRMDLAAPLRLLHPQWMHDMIRADLTRQVPGDSGGSTERLATTDAEIANWFQVRGVNPTGYLDSPTGASTLQGFGIQGTGQLLPWPVTTICYLFHEGAWMFLDGGELNLGMVRDSTLNRTNDFQMFSESFERAVFRGHESQQLTMSIAPTGGSAGTVAVSSETIGS